MDFEQLLEHTLNGLGYDLVGWERGGKSGLLRVFLDKPGGINLDDCAHVSEHLSRMLTVEGIDYGRLEVSSPGLNRVLRRERDFARFVGEKVRVTARVALDGRRNFTGTLRAVHDGKLELEVDGKLLALEMNNLEKARLVPDI